jgi:hypothetical protein
MAGDVVERDGLDRRRRCGLGGGALRADVAGTSSQDNQAGNRTK